MDNADLGTAAPAVAFALFDDGHERLHEDIRRIVRTAKELALHLKGRKVPTRVVERGRKAADLAGSHLCNLALVELENLWADLVEFEITEFENADDLPLPQMIVNL